MAAVAPPDSNRFRTGSRGIRTNSQGILTVCRSRTYRNCAGTGSCRVSTYSHRVIVLSPPDIALPQLAVLLLPVR